GVSGAHGAVDYAATLSREGDRGVAAIKPGDANGYSKPDPSGYVRETGAVKLGYTPLVGHRVGLSLSQSQLDSHYDSARYVPPDYIADPSPDFRNRLVTQISALDYRGVVDPAWTVTAQYAHSRDDLKSGADLEARYTTVRDQLTWQNALGLGAGRQLVLAYEHLSENAATTAFPNDYTRANNAGVVGYTGQFGSQTLQADLRHDQNTIYGGVTTGRLGWSLALAPGLRLRTLGGTTFRAPSFNELFYPQYGVQTLAPERGRSAEIGLNWRSGDSEVALTVYRNLVRDLINYEADPSLCPSQADYPQGCARNIGHARLQGATFSGARRWGPWRVTATLDVLDAKDSDTGVRLPRRAAHQESLSADYDGGPWAFGASVLDVGSRPDGGVTLGGYATLDLHVRWRLAPQWQLEAKLLNATDKAYEPARDYQPLGRQAWVGVRYASTGQ
ncbi:MAG: TonB-dependent receptor, partial [Pseudomonadota bacterium]|nr:TonB-dependent receptor [Pseudomonadota bacterium]